MPPRVDAFSSAASTIASTPRRLASRTIASPARRARTTAVATSTPSYSSPTALARISARRARLSSLSGTGVSSGCAVGTSTTHTAPITAPPPRRRRLAAPVHLADRLGEHQRPPGALELALRHRRVERLRHRHLEHPERLDHRPALAGVVVLLGRQAPCGLHDVIVERGAGDRHE